MKPILLALLLAPITASASCKDLLAELSPQIDNIATLVAHHEVLRAQADQQVPAALVGNEIEKKKQALVDLGVDPLELNASIGERLSKIDAAAPKPPATVRPIDEMFQLPEKMYMESVEWGQAQGLSAFEALMKAAKTGNAKVVEGFLALPQHEHPEGNKISGGDFCVAFRDAVIARQIETALILAREGYGGMIKDFLNLPPEMTIVVAESVRYGASLRPVQKEALFTHPTDHSHLVIGGMVDWGNSFSHSKVAALAAHPKGLASIKEIHRGRPGVGVKRLAHTDPRAIDAAAEAGQLETVKYLQSVGAEANKNTLLKAATSNHPEVLRHLVNSGAPDIDQALFGAIRESSFTGVRLLVETGATQKSLRRLETLVTLSDDVYNKWHNPESEKVLRYFENLRDQLSLGIDQLVILVRKHSEAQAAGADGVVLAQLKKERDEFSYSLIARGLSPDDHFTELKKRLETKGSVERVTQAPQAPPPVTEDETWKKFTQAMELGVRGAMTEPDQKLRGLVDAGNSDLVHAMLEVHRSIRYSQVLQEKYPDFKLEEEAILQARDVAISRGQLETARAFLDEGYTWRFVEKAIAHQKADIAILGIEEGLSFTTAPDFEGGDRVVAAMAKRKPNLFPSRIYEILSDRSPHDSKLLELKNLVKGNSNWKSSIQNPLMTAMDAHNIVAAMHLVENGADIEEGFVQKVVVTNNQLLFRTVLNHSDPAKYLDEPSVRQKLWAVQDLWDRGVDIRPILDAADAVPEHLQTEEAKAIYKFVREKTGGTP